MIKALEDIKNAVDPEAGNGQDMDSARQLADAYVAANPDQFTSYADMSIVEIVKAIDVMRAAGMADDQWRLEAWHLHKFEPQDIGGVTAPQLRIHGK